MRIRSVLGFVVCILFALLLMACSQPPQPLRYDRAPREAINKYLLITNELAHNDTAIKTNDYFLINHLTSIESE